MKIFDAVATLTAETKSGEVNTEQVAAETGADSLLISKSVCLRHSKANPP